MQKKYFNSKDARSLVNTYGFSLFPIHGVKEDGTCTCNNKDCGSIGKHPATPDGFKSASNDIERIKKLWAAREGLNVGIATGKVSGIFVVDIDSPEAEKNLYAQIELPDTFKVKTGRGLHLYFKYDPNRPVRNGAHIIEGVDIRGDGGYVAGPGSNHANGVKYEVVNPLEQFADAPEELYGLIENQRIITAPPKPLMFTNQSWSLDQIRDHLSYIDPDMPHDDWVKIGMALHEENVPFYVFDEWSRNGVKYKNGETQAKWKSFHKGGGVTYGTVVALAKQGGWKSKPNTVTAKPNTVKETINLETGEIEEPAPLKAIDIKDLDLDSIPPRSWLFGNIATRKVVTIVGASPGVGKSIFTMQVGVCAVANKTFGAHDAKEPDIKTWVYNNEEGEEELRRRLKAILSYEQINQSDLAGRFFMNSGEDRSICIARKNLDDGGVIHTPDFDALKAEVLRRGIDLLIVDPFAETHALSENSNDEIKEVMRLYRRIAIECNCAVVLVHHTRKGGGSETASNEQGGNADNLRGGGAQIGVARLVFTMAKMDGETARRMDVPDDMRHYYTRFDDAKSNITAPTKRTQWFKFKSKQIVTDIQRS